MSPAIWSIDIFDARSLALSLTGTRQSSYLSSLPFLFRSLKASPFTVSIFTPDWLEYPKVGPLGFFTKMNPVSCCSSDQFFVMPDLLLVNINQRQAVKRTTIISVVFFLLFFIFDFK